MPRSLILKLLLSAVLLVALALPAAAQATLSYVRGSLSPVVYAAADDGSGAKKVSPGRTPQVSPDGDWLAYLHEGPGHAQELKLAAAGGGAGKTLMVGWRETAYLAFSPDSTTVAALRGPELGKRSLVLINVASGAQRVVAKGYFNGFSFSPSGAELAYGRAPTEKFPPRSDVFRVSTGAGAPAPLTRDHRSLDPLWGPNDQIVFVKQVDAKQRRYGPKNELYLMNPRGKALKRLTHTDVDPLLQGLFPTAWSADGRRLLAEFEGQDTSYAVTVNVLTGAQEPLLEAEESGFVGTALSGDGETVLGFTGGFDPGNRHDVATVPFSGGKLKVLARNAGEPSWSR